MVSIDFLKYLLEHNLLYEDKRVFVTMMIIVIILSNSQLRKLRSHLVNILFLKIKSIDITSTSKFLPLLSTFYQLFKKSSQILKNKKINFLKLVFIFGIGPIIQLLYLKKNVQIIFENFGKRKS